MRIQNQNTDRNQNFIPAFPCHALDSKPLKSATVNLSSACNMNSWIFLSHETPEKPP